jgi:RND family efflux transporter MFP subunit
LITFNWSWITGLSDLAIPKVKVEKVRCQNPAARASLSGVASNGYVVARTRAALSADTPGRLVEMNVMEGSYVTAGTAVARLYHDEHEASLARAKADLDLSAASLARSEADIETGEASVERADSDLRAAQAAREVARANERLAKTDLERAEALVEQGIERVQLLDRTMQAFSTATAEVERAEATVGAAMAAVTEARSRLSASRAGLREAEARQQVAHADVDAAEASLEKTYIRAPFDGVVVHKEAEVGEVVSPNSAGGRSRGSVVTMVDLSSLEVQAEVPETSLSAVREGGRAQVFIDAWPTESYEVRVDRIWPMADRQKATIEVRAVFLEPDERLRPEMGLRIVFLAADDEGVLQGADELLVTVSESAMVMRDSVEGVFLIEDSRVTFTPIECSEGPNGGLVVESGLIGGESVVLHPTEDLSDGDTVRTQ